MLSLLGLINDLFLFTQYRREKRTGEKMFCLFGGKCSDVVGSKFGRTFGIKNEIYGMFYYLLILIYSLIYFLSPQITGIINYYIKIVVLITIVFSIYLILIQSFILKKYCSWCIIAVIINFAIFYVLF